MTETAQLIGYRLIGGDRDYGRHMDSVHSWTDECTCPRTEEWEWHGDERGVATVSGDLVFHHTNTKAPAGKTFRVGGLSLRVVDMVPWSGGYRDLFYVTLADNPHGELQVFYRRAAKWLLRKVVKAEARVRGFMLQPVDGRVMKVAERLSKVLL